MQSDEEFDIDNRSKEEIEADIREREKKQRIKYLIKKYSGFNVAKKIIESFIKFYVGIHLFALRAVVVLAVFLSVLVTLGFIFSSVIDSISNLITDSDTENISGRPYLANTSENSVLPITEEEVSDMIAEYYYKECVEDADFIELVYDQMKLNNYYYSLKFEDEFLNPVTKNQLSEKITILENTYELTKIALFIRTNNIDSNIEDLDIQEDYIDSVLYGMFVNTYDNLWARYQMLEYIEDNGPFISNSEVTEWYLMNESYSAVNWRKTDEYIDFIQNKLGPDQDYGNHIVDEYESKSPWILDENYPRYTLREACSS